MDTKALFHGSLVDTSRILYTPSNFAKLSLSYIQEIGTLQATKPHISKRDHLNSYLFFIVQSGSGILSYHTHEYPLNAGDCVFIDCKQPYYHSTNQNLWKLTWIHFNGPTIPNIYQKYVERGGQPVFHPDSTEKYLDVYQNLHKIASSNSYVRDMEINAELSALLSLLMKDSWHPEYSRNHTKKSTLAEIKAYLDENYTKKITLDELAERYYINKYYLTRIFKAQYGTSINAYLQEIRITQAKHELRFSDKSIEEIAAECGIGELYYFSRVFKNIEGTSPSEYRKQWN